MQPAKKNKILYWTFTLLFGLPSLFSGFAYFAGVEEINKVITQLGYPLYILKIIGTAKILGVTAILYGRFKTLKEWAYAGFTINFLGATASHILAGDPPQNVVAPLLFLALTSASYFFWKKTS